MSLIEQVRIIQASQNIHGRFSALTFRLNKFSYYSQVHVQQGFMLNYAIQQWTFQGPNWTQQLWRKHDSLKSLICKKYIYMYIITQRELHIYFLYINIHVFPLTRSASYASRCRSSFGSSFHSFKHNGTRWDLTGGKSTTTQQRFLFQLPDYSR